MGTGPLIISLSYQTRFMFAKMGRIFLYCREQMDKSCHSLKLIPLCRIFPSMEVMALVCLQGTALIYFYGVFRAAPLCKDMLEMISLSLNGSFLKRQWWVLLIMILTI